MKKELLGGLEKSRYFAIIADEVTDQYANKEVLAFCIRFVEQGKEAAQIKEVFLNFISLERTTGQALSAKPDIGDSLLELLKKKNLDVQNIRGQAYDGASAMSSEQCGAQAVIKRQNALALYTHCNSHLLNLAIATSSRQQEVRNLIRIINQLFLFFDLS